MSLHSDVGSSSELYTLSMITMLTLITLLTYTDLVNLFPMPHESQITPPGVGIDIPVSTVTGQQTTPLTGVTPPGVLTALDMGLQEDPVDTTPQSDSRGSLVHTDMRTENKMLHERLLESHQENLRFHCTWNNKRKGNKTFASTCSRRKCMMVVHGVQALTGLTPT
jgi:hypothetical protein